MKIDCAFINHTGDAPECRVLSSCCCADSAKCSFYKSAETLRAEQLSALARLKALPNYEDYISKYKSHLIGKS